MLRMTRHKDGLSVLRTSHECLHVQCDQRIHHQTVGLGLSEHVHGGMAVINKVGHGILGSNIVIGVDTSVHIYHGVSPHICSLHGCKTVERAQIVLTITSILFTQCSHVLTDSRIVRTSHVPVFEREARVECLRTIRVAFL